MSPLVELDVRGVSTVLADIDDTLTTDGKLTADQMRNIDRRTTERFGVPSIVQMLLPVASRAPPTLRCGKPASAGSSVSRATLPCSTSRSSWTRPCVSASSCRNWPLALIMPPRE